MKDNHTKEYYDYLIELCKEFKIDVSKELDYQGERIIPTDFIDYCESLIIRYIAHTTLEHDYNNPLFYDDEFADLKTYIENVERIREINDYPTEYPNEYQEEVENWTKVSNIINRIKILGNRSIEIYSYDTLSNLFDHIGNSLDKVINKLIEMEIGNDYSRNYLEYLFGLYTYTYALSFYNIFVDYKLPVKQHFIKTFENNLIKYIIRQLKLKDVTGIYENGKLLPLKKYLKALDNSGIFYNMIDECEKWSSIKQQLYLLNYFKNNEIYTQT